jgi:hypothetical protein
MKRWPLRLLLVVLVASFVATLLPGVRESLVVDRCLDGGGAYDYAAHICRTDVQTLPMRRSPLLRMPDLGSAVVALAIAIAMIRLFTTLDRRAKSRATAV